jgi:hypothetical protein
MTADQVPPGERAGQGCLVERGRFRCRLADVALRTIEHRFSSLFGAPISFKMAFQPAAGKTSA